MRGKTWELRIIDKLNDKEYVRYFDNEAMAEYESVVYSMIGMICIKKEISDDKRETTILA